MPEVAPQPASAAVPPAPPPAAPAESEASAPAQNIADQAPAAAPEGTKPDTDQDPEKQRSSRRFERRLDKAYRRAAEAEARAQLFEKQLTEAQQRQQPATDPSAPRLEQFKDIEEYATAKAEYEKKRFSTEQETKQRTQAAKESHERLTTMWQEKAERAEDKYDDFETVVGEIRPVNDLSIAIIEADNAEDIAYYLGKNLKEAQRIAALPPRAAIREIGKIEAKLLAEPPKPRTPSKAPAPITPLKGAAPVATDIPSEQDDMKTWMRKRQKQVHRR